ncbi:Crocetin glucosyltransferase 3 [Linum perenne]
MLPAMAHGHLIPFLSLARQFLRRRPSLTITIATTPLNINYLTSTLDPATADSNILLSSLPFHAADHGLPPDSENAGDITLDVRLNLYHAISFTIFPRPRPHRRHHLPRPAAVLHCLRRVLRVGHGGHHLRRVRIAQVHVCLDESASPESGGVRRGGGVRCSGISGRVQVSAESAALDIQRC